MTNDVERYQATSFCERTALHARRLLHEPNPTSSMLEDVRGCILAIEQTRERVPTTNPGFHEAALMRLVQAYTGEQRQ